MKKSVINELREKGEEGTKRMVQIHERRATRKSDRGERTESE